MKLALALAPAALACALVVSPRPAAAHIQLTYPPQRTEEQKVGPCGNGGGARSASVTVLQPGQKIVVEWDETVEHPGHFRISFDEDGDDDFATPASYDEACSNDKVLIDLIPDRKASKGDRHYRQEITLPNVECERCTLQVIQMMTDKPPYTTDSNSNDLYFQCADLALRGRPAAAAPAPMCLTSGFGAGNGGPSGAGGAAGTGAGGGTGGAGPAAGTGGASADDESGGDDGCAYGGAPGAQAVGALGLAAALAALAAARRSRAARPTR